MAIVVGLDVHRAQITYDALNTASGEVTTGRVTPPERGHGRDGLAGSDAERAAALAALLPSRDKGRLCGETLAIAQDEEEERRSTVLLVDDGRSDDLALALPQGQAPASAADRLHTHASVSCVRTANGSTRWT